MIGFPKRGSLRRPSAAHRFLYSRYLNYAGLFLSVLMLFGGWYLSDRYVHYSVQKDFEFHVSEHLELLQERVLEHNRPPIEAVAKITAHRNDFLLEITDSRGAALYRSTGWGENPSTYVAERKTAASGEEWNLRYTSSPSFDAANKSLYPILFAIMGVAVQLFLLYIIVELLRSRTLVKTKAAELESSLVWLDTILTSSVDGLHILNQEGKIIACSPSFLKLIGYSEEESKDLSVYDWETKFPAEAIPAIMDSITDMPMTFESIFRRKDGTLIDVETSAKAIVEGNIRYIYASSRDISERKRTEKALRESESFYKSMFSSLNEAIIILDHAAIVDCNAVAEEIFEISKEMFVGHSLIDAFPEPECMERSFDQCLEWAHEQGVTRTECSFRFGGGRTKIIDLTLSRFGSPEEEKLILIARDVTKKSEEERLLRMYTRQAQMGEMISMIAHQWRQPLAIINAIISQMRLKALVSGESDPQVIENLIKIEEQSSHLSQTISDYRDFFRPDKPKEHFSVSSLLQNALNLVDHTLKNHSIRIETWITCDPLLYTYRNEVLQVIMALLENAFDAFLETKRKEGNFIMLGVDQDETYAILTLRDNAGGIAPEAMKKLFTPYFTTKQKSYGTGLGLYMSKIIIQEHCHGTIALESHGEETVVTVKLPYQKGES